MIPSFLVQPLVERTGTLTVVELDRDLAARLRERFSPAQLTLVEGDALELYFGATSGSVFGSPDAGASWFTVAEHLPPAERGVLIELAQRIGDKRALFAGMTALENLLIAQHNTLMAASGWEVVAVPGLLALAFGFFAFRSRIKGVYFSIITQALTFAAMLLFFRNETGFGGNNGFTDFKRILDIPIALPSTRMVLFVLTGLTLIGCYLMARAIVHSKFGRVLQAIRDAESRVMFTGYDPLAYKLAIWTLSAVMCGVAGALYVPQVGIINPGEMGPAASIEIAVWAAVGGRGTLIGPIVGAFFVNGTKSWFTQAFPEFWLYFLGALFIAVTLFLPNGLVGLVEQFKGRRKERA